MAHKSDADLIEKTHNTARHFTEHRQIGWVLLIAVVVWGWYGYTSMPQRKDPDIPVRVAVALCSWPGVNTQKVEQLVTRPIEQTVAENQHIHPAVPDQFGIRSLTLPGLSIVTIQLAENVTDPKKYFSDINLKLNELNNRLPDNAGPIRFLSDFGDTAALMLTVASPKVNNVEIAVRARTIQKSIERVRARRRPKSKGKPFSLVTCFPQSISPSLIRRHLDAGALYAQSQFAYDVRQFEGPGFVGLDGFSELDDAGILKSIQRFYVEHLHRSELHPDGWAPFIVKEPQETKARLASVAGDKYSYQELDSFTDLIARTVLGAAQTSKVDRTGVLPQRVYLEYSQERLASYGLQPSNLKNILGARNITLPGGMLEVGNKNLLIDPSGEFTSAQAVGDVIVGTSASGSPVYLRDLVDIIRGYQSPAQFLNYYSWREPGGKWHRSRAVTVAVYMRSGEQIHRFGESVDAKLAAARQLLPHDLIIARTSDQPRQVKENIDLFMDALYEAIVLVVLVSMIGFWDWRSALLMACSIPITLALTFGMAQVLGVDLQQVSIATLIIALGLLVDDPVVAGDAIKNGLAAGHPPLIAAWLGPTRLSHAIWYATITNIAAYLPFLLLSGNTGSFLFTLPVVMSCSLIASRIVSTTFIPFLGYYLLRPSKTAESSIEVRRTRGFTGHYHRIASLAVEHRWKVLAVSLLFLGLGGYLFSQLRQQFFPYDVQYWSYVDVWLPNDAPLIATNETSQKVENIIRNVSIQYDREHPGKDGKPGHILESLTTFVGGGGPRFWFSVTPELQQLNYAQVIIQVSDKEATSELVPLFQRAIAESVAGARIDVRQLQTNPVEMPVAIQIAGQADVASEKEAEDIRTLRRIAKQVEDIFRSIPQAARVRNDWQEESSVVKLIIDPDRANLAGITNFDVAASSTAALSGSRLTTLREGDKQIPVVGRLRVAERAQLSDIKNLYVYSSEGKQKVPLLQISTIEDTMETQRIRRLEHFRTITVECFPERGALASDVLNAAMPRLERLQKSMPLGYKMQIAGEKAAQERGFKDLVMVLAISVTLIFLALVMQFNHAVKPFLVLGAAPYGVVGALMALAVMGTPFGFMAFLGIASLIGVIVSHVIVLFDFVEEMHEKGAPFKQALIDAGIERLRPVMITVGATILALFPLAMHGGPLWQPLCYAQIGGLAVATFVTLLMVPVLYSIFVLDLKIVKWESKPTHERAEG